MHLGTDIDIGTLCANCSDYIYQETAFRVHIKEKKHNLVVELLTHDAIIETINPSPIELLNPGCCILCSLSHLVPVPTALATRLADPRDSISISAAKRGFFTYSEVASLFGVTLVPRPTLDMTGDGLYLLHVENDGHPHCVAVSVKDEGKVVKVIDGAQSFDVNLAKLESSVQEGVDRQSAMVFSVLQVDSDGAWHGSYNKDTLRDLLDLEAGARHKITDDESSEDGDVDTSSNSSASGTETTEPVDTHEHVIDDDDEERKVRVGDELLLLLKTEVDDLINRLRSTVTTKREGKLVCPLCPFRAFAGSHKQRLISHVHRYHVESRQFCCSGTKQMKVVLALHDSDGIAQRGGSGYLTRSAAILRASIAPPLSSTVNHIDRDIRLVLTAGGPKYMNISCTWENSELRKRKRLT